MQKFHNRIYLILTMEPRDLGKLYFECIASLFFLALYNLIGLYFNLPMVIHYPPIVIAVVLVTAVFVYFYFNRLPIDWELLDAQENEVTVEKETKEQPQDVAPVSTEPSNEEIQMIEEEEEMFSFTDTLTEVYNKGTAKDLAHIAVHGTQMKVENIR
jgi:hypothetical protein